MSREPGGALPRGVRSRLAALAADALARLDDADVPPSLKAVRRFTPAKRLRLGAGALCLALDVNDAFRGRVLASLPEAPAAVADALAKGEALAATDPTEVAAVAYLLRAPGWQERMAVVARLDAAAATIDADREQQGAERERVAELASLRGEVERLTLLLGEQQAVSQAETEQLRRRLRSADGEARRRYAGQSQDLTSALEAAVVARNEAETRARVVRDEMRGVRAQLADAESALAHARRDVRAAREAGQARLRVLVDTLSAAAAGLRRELDLPAVVLRPADTASPGGESMPDALAGVVALRARGGREPAVVDAALGVPGVHVIIDGYNVTKTGYGDVALAAQRSRLLAGLGALVSRQPVAVELTCVFDGTAATVRPVATVVPRGVRVLFSAVGELADHLIIRLVRAEPTGRPVAVVTNDKEVVEHVEAAGARALSSEALLARLDRG